jgi:alpha-glucosidase
MFPKIFNIFFIFLFIFQCSSPIFNEPDTSGISKNKKWTLNSPDGKGMVEIINTNLSSSLPFFNNTESLYYKVSYEGKTLVEWSPLGIDYENINFYSDLELVGITERIDHDKYNLAHGKKSIVDEQFKEFILRFKNKSQKIIELLFRLQNNGVGFRYRIPAQEGISAKGKIIKEYSGFRFPKNSDIWQQEYQEASKVSPAYEYYFTKGKTGDDHSGKASIRSIFQPLVGFTGLVIFGSDGWAFPALIETPSKQYVLLTEAGLNSQYVATHMDVDSKTGLYTIAFPAQKEGQGIGEVIPTASLPFLSTWKIIGYGDLKSITESTIVTDFSEPLDPIFNNQIPSWIISGKSTWDWWSYLETGDLERQKKYADSASDFGWEYVLVDANWNKWNNGDSESQIKELVKYAGEKNVSVILWYNSGGSTNLVMEEPRDRLFEKESRKKEFAKLKEWGIKGIKIDFWQSDKQMMVQKYLDVLRDAALFNLLINFHGATMPRGWERQFPNLMTVEAVKGAEWYRFPVFSGPSSRDNVYYFFTRNNVGPMDYTPVVFETAYDQQKIGYAHSLALTVIFESAIQHFADNADDEKNGYKKIFNIYPFVKQFMKEVPTSWDETKYLEGHPDSHIVIARRKGTKWYIAGISSSNKKLKISFPLTFIGQEKYTVNLITEDEKGNKLKSIQQEFTKDSITEIEILPHGGFVMDLSL